MTQKDMLEAARLGAEAVEREQVKNRNRLLDSLFKDMKACGIDTDRWKHHIYARQIRGEV